jgi:hypothetical protein
MDIFGSLFLAIIAAKHFRLCDIPQQLERKSANEDRMDILVIPEMPDISL